MLEFIDGFDYYNGINLKWHPASVTGVGFVTGRFGGFAFTGGVAGKFLPQTTSKTVGTALLVSNLGNIGIHASVIGFLDTTTSGSYFDGRAAQLVLAVTSVGSLQVLMNNGSTIVATSAANVIVENTWYYVEFQLVVNTSYTVKVNGVTVLTGTGAYQTTSNAFTDGVAIQEATYDDLYILNPSGSYNTTFLGECRIKADLPSGDGTYSQFTTLSGSHHYAMVNSYGPSETTYNYDANPGDIDTYTFDAESISGGTVVAIQNSYIALKDDAGVRTAAEIMRIAGTNYVGTTQSLTSSYYSYSQMHEVNPNTNAPWNISDINSSEIGVTVIS